MQVGLLVLQAMVTMFLFNSNHEILSNFKTVDQLSDDLKILKILI